MSGVVGIIANPESGRDIRRLVSHASVFDNMEKVNIVERILTTLQVFGIKKALVMPESFGIVPAAVNTLGRNLKMEIEYVPIKVFDSWKDTYEAVKLMKDKVNAIVVIGGDGTNRIVAKLSDDIPIMPISTGTNNVFPYMIEATIAAEATAAILTGIVKKEEGTFRAKRLDIIQDGELKDIALIDVAVTTHSFIGSKAVWKTEFIKEVIVSKPSPFNIGLSSIASVLSLDEEKGVYVELGEGNSIKAPIAPGTLKDIGIKNVKTLSLGEEIKIKNIPSILALDGEREFEVKVDTYVKLTQNGPLVIDYKKTLRIAAERGFFKGDFYINNL
ncbi:MAG: NAD(+)/NADH kinase [Caldisericaceae bacterium]